MDRKFWALIPVAVALTLVVGGCSLPRFLTSPTATPEPTATPSIVYVVATPTPGAIAIGADEVEARRVAVYQRVAPAVVNITTQVLRSSFFWGTTPEEGSGSGFLWDNEGDIVTNYHVIQGASQIVVSFGDDVSLVASVVGSDPINDLAVVRVDSIPESVTPVDLGTSAGLQVGQTAIVIGNPFGQFERTMTVGIISALNRTIQTDSSVLRGVIQTDAAINRGNSGGPLLDSSGRLIGVNSAIYSPTGTSAGVGLAIPVDKVQRVVPVLIDKGRYPHPWLGVEQLGYEISPALAQGLGLNVDSGLLVAQLYRDSPAYASGVRGAQSEKVFGNRRYMVGGDIIIEVNGQPMETWDDLSGYLEENTEVGQTITLTLVRDGRQIDMEVTLADTPDSLLNQ